MPTYKFIFDLPGIIINRINQIYLKVIKPNLPKSESKSNMHPICRKQGGKNILPTYTRLAVGSYLNRVCSSNKFRSSDLLNLDRSSRRSPAKSQSTASVEATRAAHGDHHGGGTGTSPGAYCPSDGSPPPLWRRDSGCPVVLTTPNHGPSSFLSRAPLLGQQLLVLCAEVQAAADQPSASQRYYYQKAHEAGALRSC